MSAVPETPRKREGILRMLWRISRQVFHESAGAMFFVLALFWGNGALRQWRMGAELWLCLVTLGFSLVLVVLGFFSFRTARRVR